jgi:alpha-L-glutamate ligase-like protein/uncharacterized protein (TIGR02421 family)
MRLLSNHGVLGINARNLLYIRPLNKKKAIKLADSKLKSKSFLSARGIPVPKLYGMIRGVDEIDKFDFSSLPNSFVLKPNRGAGGEGIIPVWDRRDGKYILSGGQEWTQDQLEEHIADIISGRFSISGISDIAFFEQLLICDERLAKFAYKGLPDLRIVVYNLIPIMAMLRLPTRASKGKANLHQGAVGVGIDIAKGQATHIVQGTRILDEVPDAGEIRGLEIPYWDEILMISSQLQMATNLGYMAADISIDQNSGPVLLEVNARAGLGLQIANLAPLRRRLEQVANVKVPNPEKGVRVAKDMFGNVIEKEIKQITGKAVVGTIEPVKVLVGSRPYRVMAHINSNIEKSQIDFKFAEKTGLKSDQDDVAPKIKFILAGKRVQTIVSFTDLSTKDYDLVVGRRDLSGFLVDPTRKLSHESGINALPKAVELTEEVVTDKKRRNNFRVIDSTIFELDEQIKLLYHLKPTNLLSEESRFLKGEIENPQFLYPDLKFDPYELREKLEQLDIDDSLIGRVFDRKRHEIIRKIDLLEHRGTSHFYNKSIALFGQVSSHLLADANEAFSSRPKHFKSQGKVVSAEQAAQEFEKFFVDHGLKDWKVKLKESMVADCTAGKKGVFFVRADAEFTETRLKMVIAHEIETHIYTAENGKSQPYKIFQRGTGDYLLTQEGLAIYNQEQAVDQLTDKHFWNMALVIAIHAAQEGSFRDVYDLMIKMDYSEEKAFKFALKSKRGLEDTSVAGAFTKDIIYFRGKRLIEDFIAKGGDLRRLYVGKIDLPSLDELEELPFLVSPKFYPSSYLT